MCANFDVAGQSITLCIKDVKNLSEIVRKNLALANDKERSLGVLCEQLYESCSAAAQLQLSTVQSALMGFSCTLQRIELQRQALFQRIAPLSANALLISAKNTHTVGQALQKRDLAIKKAQNLPPAATDPKAAQSNLIRTQAVSLNNQATQEVRNWCIQYNADLKSSVREYAHAQMEFAAKALEQWSCFLEDLTLLDFSRDTDEMVTMLEEGGALQTQ